MGSAKSRLEEARSFTIEPTEQIIKEALSLRDFWQEFDSREASNSNKAVFVCGFLICILAIVFDIVVEAERDKPVKSSSPSNNTLWNNASSHGDENNFTTTALVSTTAQPPVECATDFTSDPNTLHYIVVQIAVAALCQIFFSVAGITYENLAMLVVANINAIGLAVRLSFKLLIEPDWLDIVIISSHGLICVCHVGFSISAYMYSGGFSRYVGFAIGGNLMYQRMYHQYEILSAAVVMDLQWSSMATITMFFFSGEANTQVAGNGVDGDDHHHWLRDSLFALMLVMCAIMRFVVIRVVRKELNVNFFLLCFAYVLMPVAVIVGVAVPEFLAFELPCTVRSSGWFTIIAFLIVRLFVCVALGLCMRNFGEGMKDAFARERTITDLVAKGKYDHFTGGESIVQWISPLGTSEARMGGDSKSSQQVFVGARRSRDESVITEVPPPTRSAAYGSLA